MNLNTLISQFDPNKISNHNYISAENNITPLKTAPPITAHSIEQTHINSATIIEKSNHILGQNKQIISQYKELLDLARNKISIMQSEGVPLSEIQSFISTIYANQLKAIFTIAMNAMSTPCPVGDNWAVIGLGSLGRGNVNPYSDLDFAIAVDEHTPDVENYFKELLTHVNQLIDEYHDNGMFLCKGHITPPYYTESDGYTKTDGSKELFGTPEKLAQYTLTTIRDRSMALDIKANSLLDGNLLFGSNIVSTRFIDTLKNDYSKQSPTANNRNMTNWQSTGLLMLRSGGTFWRHLTEIDNLNYNNDNPPKGFLTNPCCNIKEAIIRPLQNSIQGLSLFYRIREPNTLKALDLLIEGNHIPKPLGEKLKIAYEFISFLRIKIELEKKTESTDVTCCNHNISFLAKERNALILNESEKETISEIKQTLNELKDYTFTLISEFSQ